MRMRTLAAYGLAAWLMSSGGAGAQTSLSNVVRSTAGDGIEFTFDNSLDGYAVSGVWYPLATPPAHTMLVGPAVFQLRNATTGKAIKIAENAISLLNDAYLKAHPIDPQQGASPVGLIAALKSRGVLRLNYSGEDRARKVPCRESRDTCLAFGDIPIDLQDVNFDGKPEVIVTQQGMAQRFGDAYRVFTIDFDDADGASPEIGTVPYDDAQFQNVLGRLDDMSTIDLTRKRISIYLSGGACANSNEVFGLNPDTYDAGFSLLEYWSWQTDEKGDCIEKIYHVKYSPIGVPAYKLFSLTKNPQ